MAHGETVIRTDHGGANRCIDCGEIIAPRSMRCRVHAAARARSEWRNGLRPAKSRTGRRSAGG